MCPAITDTSLGALGKDSLVDEEHPISNIPRAIIRKKLIGSFSFNWPSLANSID